MPELPEAETIVRTLAPHLVRRRILRVDYLAARACRGPRPKLDGRMVTGLRRHGKQILIALDEGFLLVKLGMTGSLRVDAPAGPYTRAVIHLDRGTVNFDDIRQFGSLEWRAEPPGSGPDPMEIGAADLAARLAGCNSAIKRLLLDQSFLRGIGNIYADEILFRAGIDPRARRLGRARAAKLHSAMREVLALAIRHRGSSVSDYVDAAGARGGFQKLHQVYRRNGQPCPRCGAPIRRIVVAQRGTHFCAKCQRR